MSKTIAIRCRDSSHDDKPYTVAVFYEVEQHRAIQSPRWWLADLSYSTRGGIKQKLLREEYVHPYQAEYVEGPGVRERYRLACEKCGLCVERRIHVDPEQDPVQRALDKIDAAGLNEVTLSAFAAIVNRS